MDSRQEVRSLKKALRALTVMNEKGDATVTEVARAIGAPRTTAYRLLETLASEGYVHKQPHSDFYRLTSKVTQLAAGFQGENLLLEVARPHIDALGRRIGWSVSLSTPRGAEMVIRITTTHDSALALDRYAIGLAVPMLHATAGFCHLACCDEAERERLLEIARASGDPLQAMAHDRPRLDPVLKRVRERGFCNIEFARYREGNVAVPLLMDGRSRGGLVMRYIKSAMTADKLREDYIPRLRELARTIAGEYGARSSRAPLDDLHVAAVRGP